MSSASSSSSAAAAAAAAATDASSSTGQSSTLNQPRRVVKKPSKYYMKIHIAFESPASGGGGASSSSSSAAAVGAPDFTSFLVQAMVQTAVEDFFGVVGQGAWRVSVLAVDAGTQTAVLSLPASGAVPVRGALSLLSSYNELPCAVYVLAASSFLTGLAVERHCLAAPS